MKTYRIFSKENCRGEYIVEAESEEEARETLLEGTFLRGMILESEFDDIESVEEIK